MRCWNFFSAAIRQVSGAWPSFLDNKSWIPLFFTPVALLYYHLLFPCHPNSNPLLFLCRFHSLSFFFCLLLCPCLPQRFVQRTVVAMAFVYQAAAAVMMAGWALGVTRGRVTLAAMNTAPARTENVNAAPVGTESTALLVGWEEGFYGMGLWVCMCLWRDLRVNTNAARLSACVCL